MRRRHYIAAAVLVVFFLLIRFVGEIGQDVVAGFRVVRIIDGDTVELDGQGRVRLLGIDTPEQGDLFHDSAMAFLTTIALGREATLRFDGRQRDHYGRLLAYLYIDTLFVNEAILKNGLAYLYLFRDNMKDAQAHERLLAAQRQSMASHVGLWTLPYTEESHYVGNARTFRFHRPACPSAEKLTGSNRVIFERREEAFYQGYSPCRNCRP